MSTSDKFSNFCSNLRMSDATVSNVRLRYHNITKRLNKDFRGIENDITYSLYVGSYGRGTAIHVSDIDMLYILPWSYYTKYNSYISNGQSALLQAVRDSVKQTYPVTDISGDGQVVKVWFSDDVVFEIVPCFEYSDGSFNYIPVLCDDEYCDDEKCPFSHNENELNYHPLFYKTKYLSGGKKGYFEKNANNFFDDFRIIYNYKNENIINLLKLLDEKKIAKYYFKDYYKKEMKSFKLETFKTMECPSVKSGIKCPKDAHLCYYYHNLAEKRRPPTLYRYTNVMCPDQKYKENGKIKSNCKNGDFCNKCHSRYEYYYHKLFFGKAITCMRPKKNGKCMKKLAMDIILIKKKIIKRLEKKKSRRKRMN